MKRITPEEVVEAYRVTGLKPNIGAVDCQDGSCCGLGAIAVMAGHSVQRYEYCDDTYGVPYVEGFIRGFDGACSQNLMPDRWDPARYDAGYEDGKAAATAVFKEQR